MLVHINSNTNVSNAHLFNLYKRNISCKKKVKMSLFLYFLHGVCSNCSKNSPTVVSTSFYVKSLLFIFSLKEVADLQIQDKIYPY